MPSNRIPLIAPDVWSRIQYHQRAARAAEHVCAHAHARISLVDVADAVHMEPTSFSRFFRRRVGVRFFDFVRAYRLGLAMQEMEASDTSLKEIAARTGFGSLAAFDRCFKRVTGMSPTAYRNRVAPAIPVRRKETLRCLAVD